MSFPDVCKSCLTISNTLYPLSSQQKKFWDEHGYLKLTDFFTPEEKELLPNWCKELEDLPEAPGKWMKYFEQNTTDQRQLCRIENILDYHSVVNDIARGSRTIKLLSSLMGEQAAIFKEKINFKLPGGNGFTPHQDAPAFVSFNQKYHITMMVVIDDATLDNGCLQLAECNKRTTEIYPQKSDGSLSDEVVDTITWKPAHCKTGDILLFDSYLPHYSEVNHSSKSRRAFFITFNKMSEGGSMREAYFKDKREKFPQDCERDPNKDYSAGAEIYNVANPFSAKASNSC